MTSLHAWSNARIAGIAAPATLLARGESIEWVGASVDCPPSLRPDSTTDLGGAWMLPAFVDCHTHLVYGGSRLAEFVLRAQGASYAEIAQAGGGIVSTVRATRAMSEAALLAAALPRARALLAEGVTTLEIKSGYGLDLESERKMLRVARQLGDELGIDIRTSFLGAHALPPEFEGRADDYVDELCTLMLPTLAAEGLVDAVDAFCEHIAFTPGQVARVFETARDLGLPVKLHAEQLSDQGGAELAARFGALSCEHLEYVSEAGIRAMAQAGTVAVLLPGAFYFLGETRKPPVAEFRRHGVPMAVATDLNPGSSPIASILTPLHMVCTLFGLSPAEALDGVSVHGARALGLTDRGRLEAGALASFSLWSFDEPASLAYELGLHRPTQVVHRGRVVHANGNIG